MTTEAEKRIREALAAGPTPGPWEAVARTNAYADIVALAQPGYVAKQVASVSLAGTRNAGFIAACNPETITALLADRDEREAKLRAERDFLVAEYERAVGCGAQGYTHAALHLFNAITNAQADQNTEVIEALRAALKQANSALIQAPYDVTAVLDAAEPLTYGRDASNEIEKIIAAIDALAQAKGETNE